MLHLHKRLVAAAILLLGVPPILLFPIAGDERIWSLAQNTLRLVVYTCAIALPLGTFLAVVVVRTNVLGRRLLGVIVGMMLFVPLYLHATAWDAGFGRLGWFRLADGAFLLDGMRAAAWIHAIAATPWVALIAGIALRFVPRGLEEEALLNASSRQVFLRVTLPRVFPALVVAVLWVAVITAGEMTVTDIYGVRTYAEELYVSSQLDLNQARAGAAFSALTVGWLVFAALTLASGVVPRGHIGSLQPPHVFRLRAARAPVTIFSWLLVAFVVGLPIANLAYQAGDELVTIAGAKTHRWSFSYFIDTLASTPRRFASDFRWTFAIAATAATAATILAVPLAWLARRGGWRAVPALLIAAVCLSLPGPLIGIELIRILNQRDVAWLVQLYDRSIFAPAAAMVIRSLPLAILISWYSFRSVPDDQLESAAIDGAGGWTRFWRITAAQRVTALAAVLLVGLAISMGDLAATNLVVPPGVDLLSVRVFGLLHAGVTNEVAGICLVNIAIIALVAAPALKLLKLTATRR